MRIFITHILPEDVVLKFNVSVAAHNFSYNLIRAKIFDKTYSILPTFVSGNLYKLSYKYPIRLIYSRRRNGFFKRIAVLDENLKLFKLIPRGAFVWFYNLNILNVLLILLLKIFKKSVKINIIVLDFTPSNSKLSLQTFYLWFINHADGIIRLADSDLFACNNSICLPGIVPIVESGKFPKINKITNEYLISGVLNERIAMISMLLSVFSKMPNLILHITGKSSDEALILKYSNSCPNIIYHKTLSFENYLSLLERITFVFSTRNPFFLENKCNFPSKIIESLLHNRIVISTLHYEQLSNIKYLEVSSDEDCFIRDINAIVNMKEFDLLKYANQSELIVDRFNINVWDAAMTKIEKRDEANRLD